MAWANGTDLFEECTASAMIFFNNDNTCKWSDRDSF